VLIAVTFLLQGCERAKSTLDREVDRLCAIDGGVRIFETVRLPKANFGPDGEVFPQHKGKLPDSGRYGESYRGSLVVEIIQDGRPGIARIRARITRNLDEKVLGEIIHYKRSGGDFPEPWEPSSHTCNLGAETVNFERQIFLPEGS
jgi:hypothetical protein